ncbi:NACHT domain-containing protein [Vitreoscilla filiformis]|nr:hypothetical protein [Vitreoscilla filiformis]
MHPYLDLERRFGILTKYSIEELLLINAIDQKRLDWKQVLAGRYSLITARANFGKTTELKVCAQRLREDGQHAVFVPLHRLLEESDFEIALDAMNAEAFTAWKTTSNERLYLFADSLDEAVLGSNTGLQSALRRAVEAVRQSDANVNWVLSSRPATLTPAVLDIVQGELDVTLYAGETGADSPEETPEKPADSDALRAELAAFDASSPTQAKRAVKEPLKVYSLLPLSNQAARLYLEQSHGIADPRALLEAAWSFGLAELAAGPGSLDILAYVDPVNRPPRDLTDIFDRMVSAVQTQQRSDRREELVGRPPPENLQKALETLAAASAVCQLPNMELAPDALKVRDGVLSCRPLVGSLLSEKSLSYLLGSRLFIDSGQHQVKLYPDQLLPYLAAKRLSSLAQSPDNARRLISALSWRSATGECGVHRIYLTLAGWLATLNVHCRHELLDIEPQAVAFFGDLRSDQVPLAEARTALERSLQRLVTLGDSLGRNQFTLTAENYWQAAKAGIEPTLLDLYERFGTDQHARIALLQVATYARLDVLRTKVLAEHDNDYAKLLGDSVQLRYLMSLNRDDDAQALATAAKACPNLEEQTLWPLVSQLSWKAFDVETIADLVAKQYLCKGGSFHLSWALTHELADSASPDQLATLVEALQSRMMSHCKANRATYSQRHNEFADAVQKLMALVVRSAALPVERVTALCLEYYRAHGKFHSGSAELHTALQTNDTVRQSLLRAVVTQSDRTADGIRSTLASLGMYTLWQDVDVAALAEPGFTELVITLKENATPHQATERPRKTKRDRPTLDETSKEKLLTQIETVRDGSNTHALAWIARWLTQTNHNSRYGECDFSAFEQAAGQPLAAAARMGLSTIWRHRAPEFEETKTSSTYYSTIAGLQGLHLEFGDGTSLPALSVAEVRQALSYAQFEINGYPKWFWPVVRAHQTTALDALRHVLEAADAGPVSADKADALIRHLSDAPPVVQRGLIATAWNYATSSAVRVEAHALESALRFAVGNVGGIDQDTFEAEAWSRMFIAFKDALPDTAPLSQPQTPEEQAARSELKSHRRELARLRSNGVVWGLFWLQHYPDSFIAKWEHWRATALRAADEFMFDLAAYVGQDRQAYLRTIAQRGRDGLKTLAALYKWMMAVVQEKDDLTHEDGRVYYLGARDHAQRLRDSLLPAISSAKSQAAYEVLNELREKATGTRVKYIRLLQFQMREEESFVLPFKQQDYSRFERDFAPPVTDFVAFAQAIHNDLLAVKRSIEEGDFSLRRFFNRVAMQHIKTDSDGLALEEDFQALLGSELNHASSGRYGVTLEPILPEGTRRDVLCQLGEMRATIELKMSARWTGTDYFIALDEQLKGQYMQAANSKIGFFVVVLQRERQWDAPTGERVNFAVLIAQLEKRALALQATDPTLFLRVVGIDASPQRDFRAGRVAAKATRKSPVKTKISSHDSRSTTLRHNG